MDQRRLHGHLLLLHDFDYELYEEAINDWDHTQRVMKQDYDLDMIEGWDGDYGEITYLTKTSMRAPREAKGDEVVSFSDDIKIMEIPRIGHRKVPLRRGRNQIGERRRNRLLY